MVLTNHARQKIVRRGISEARIAHAIKHGVREPRGDKYRVWLPVSDDVKLGLIVAEEGGKQVVVTVFERRPFKPRV